jgi:hypothetical protein
MIPFSLPSPARAGAQAEAVFLLLESNETIGLANTSRQMSWHGKRPRHCLDFQG